MATLEKVYMNAVSEVPDGNLVSPGAAHIADLLGFAGHIVSVCQVQEVFDEQKW